MLIFCVLQSRREKSREAARLKVKRKKVVMTKKMKEMTMKTMMKKKIHMASSHPRKQEALAAQGNKAVPDAVKRRSLRVNCGSKR